MNRLSLSWVLKGLRRPERIKPSAPQSWIRLAAQGLTLMWAIAVMAVLTLPGCGGGSTSDSWWGGNESGVTAIAIDPGSITLPLSKTCQFTATATLSNGTSTDMTNSVVWNSSNSSIASISPTGLATAKTDGQVTITATSGSVKAQATITVTTATLTGLAVSPQAPTVPVSRHLQLTATGTFSDGTTLDLSDIATWQSSDTSIVTVDNSGMITVNGQGSATVTATDNGISGSTTITASTATLVSLTVSPANPHPHPGDRVQFTATGTFSDGTTHELGTTVTWTSSDTKVAAIGEDGLSTIIANGTTTITATDMDSPSITGSTTMTVSTNTLKSLSVTPSAYTLPVGRSIQLTATATYEDGGTADVSGTAAWTSSNSSAATVDSNGLVTAADQGTGSTTVTATLSGISAASTITLSSVTLSKITILPNNPAIQVGHTQQFTATGTFSDGTTHDVSGDCTWTSADMKVATISAAGLAAGAAEGSSVITATDSGISDTTTLTVGEASKLASIAVTPNPATAAFNDYVQFTATGTYANGSTRDLTDEVIWASSDHKIAEISASGKANTGTAAGSTNITASSKDLTIQSPNAPLTVSGDKGSLVSIAIYSTDNCMKTGETLQYWAKGYYANNTVKDISSSVTWASSNTSVASIDAKTGKATAGASGQTAATTVISATPADGSGVTGVLTLVVNPTAASGSVTMTIVNNSGIPDEAVFLTHWGQNQSSNNFYYNPFCKTATTVMFSTSPAQTVGNQYSYPLVSLTRTGTNTYTFPCPKDNMFQGRINVSLTSPLSAGPASSASAMTQPSTLTAVPWDFFEPNIQTVNGTEIINFDTSNVDFFSIGLQAYWKQKSGPEKTVGFVPDGRNKVIQAFIDDPVFKECLVKNGSTTVKVLAPYNVSSPGTTLNTWLDKAITSAWSTWGGSNNSKIAWKYGAFTYSPAAGDADKINVSCSGETFSIAKPTTMAAFQQHVSGSVAQQMCEALIYSSLMRGVCDDYSSWGNHTDDSGYPDKYYVSKTLNYSNYAHILHLYSLPVINPNYGSTAFPACYAFPADDHYKQDPDSGNITLTDIDTIKLTIPSFDRAK